jgi:hypothetical protein
MIAKNPEKIITISKASIRNLKDFDMADNIT